MSQAQSPDPAQPVASGAAGDWPTGLEHPAAALLIRFAALHQHPVAFKEADSGVYRHVNAPMAELFGRRVVEVIGCTDAQLLSAPRAAALRAADHTAIAHHPQHSSTEHRFEWNGLRRHFHALRMLVSDPQDPSRQLLASIWTDQANADRLADTLSSQRLQIEQDQRLLERFTRDSQDLHTASAQASEAFTAQLRREFDLSSRERREFVLMLVELDEPSAGEPARSDARTQALQAAIDRLIVSNTRAMDSACRLSATRTAVLWSGVGLSTAYSRAEALRQQCLRYEVAAEGELLPLSVSIGLAGYPHTAAERDALLQCAVQALTRARGRGPGQIVLAAVPFPRNARRGPVRE